MKPKRLDLLICLICQLFLGGCQNVPLPGNGERWNKAMNEAVGALSDKHYYDAEKHYKDALATAETFGDDDLRLARTRLEYGEFLLKQAKVGEAEPLVRKAYYSYEKSWDRHGHDANNRDTGLLLARAELHLADIDRERKAYQEGERLYKAALATEEATMGPDALKQSILDGYGRLLHEMGDRDKAEELAENAHELTSVEQDAANAQTQSRDWEQVDKAAEEARAAGNYPLCEKLYLRAITLAEEDVVGAVESGTHIRKEKRRLPQSLLGLASAYDAQGFYSKAEPLLTRALADLKAHPMKNPRLLVEVIERTASVDAHVGALPKAEVLYREALALALSEPIKKHKHARTCMEGLTDIYLRQGDLAKAQDTMTKLVDMTEKEWGSDSEKVGDDMIILADIYEKRKQPQLAQACFEKSLAVRGGRGGKDPRRIIQTLEPYAEFLKRQHQDEKAERIAAEAKSLKSELLQEFK